MSIEQDVRQIAGLYKRAARSVSRTLLAIGVSGFREIRALEAAAKVRRMLRELDGATLRWAERTIKRNYQERMRRDKISFKVLGLKPIPGAAKRHAQGVNDFVESALTDFRKAIAALQTSADMFIYMQRRGAKAASQVQEFGEDELAEALEQFDIWAAEAVAEGLERAKLSKWIENYLAGLTDEDGLTIEIKGRTYTLEYYAELVARTKLREAQSEATKRICDEYENDLVEFSTHAKPCDECADLEGQVFSISGTDPEYPPLTDDVTPPIHPNCEHSISPTSRIGIEVGRRYSEEYEEAR